MNNKTINRINYRNKKNSDFEIVDLSLFFATRPRRHLQSDFRLNFWIILYITEGSGYHYVDFQKYSYKKGDIIFVQKNQVHRFLVNDDVKGYAVHINEPFFYRIEGFNGDIFLEFADRAFGSPVLSFDTTAESTNRMLIDLIYREYSKTDDNFNIELIATLFQGFILALRGDFSEKESVFQSKDYENFTLFRQLVEDHYTTERTVESYADRMHLSKKTVNQFTRNVTGLSAKQFIINRLILEIKRYLSQGELLNYEIAELLGFDEAANMSRFFRHYEGMSPKAFRERLKQ